MKCLIEVVRCDQSLLFIVPILDKIACATIIDALGWPHPGIPDFIACGY